MRRGQPCIHNKYGIDIATSAGCTGYFLAMNMISKSNIFKLQHQLEMYQIFSEEMLNLHLGQNFDIVWSKNKSKHLVTSEDGSLICGVTQNEYEMMCRNKTSGLLRLYVR